MSRSRPILTVTVAAAVVVAAAIIVVRASKTKRTAVHVADEIESELGDLDPVTRAAVIAKLSTDAVKDVRARRSHHSTG